MERKEIEFYVNKILYKFEANNIPPNDFDLPILEKYVKILTSDFKTLESKINHISRAVKSGYKSAKNHNKSLGINL